MQLLHITLVKPWSLLLPIEVVETCTDYNKNQKHLFWWY